MKQVVTLKDLLSIVKILYRLLCLHRWIEAIVDLEKFTELAKQAFNSAIAFVWSIEAQCQGYNIDFKVFPKVAISRALLKCYMSNISEENLQRIFELGPLSKKDFTPEFQEQISELISCNLNQFLVYDPNSLEAKIFQGATKLATIIELQEIKQVMPKQEYKEKYRQLRKDLQSFADLPGFKKICSRKYMKVFRDYSKLRNNIRWPSASKLVKCSVLGHHFDVAVFTYLMSLSISPENEELASRYFLMGFFHDFPEKWTGDMPSPIKDAIPWLRQATEKYENEVMEKNVYRFLPRHLVKALKDVMLEEESNASFKKFVKMGDNFAAFIECWRQLDSGSRHYYFVEVYEGFYLKREKLPELFRLLTEELYSDLLKR